MQQLVATVFVVGGDVLRFDASLTANGTQPNPPGTTGLGLCLEYQQSAVDDPVARARIDSAVLQAILHVRNGRADAGLQRIDGSARTCTMVQVTSLPMPSSPA